MRPIKTVMVGNMECTVETLREWLESRLNQLSVDREYLGERIFELEIILEKINDGRIQEIGHKEEK